MNDVQALLEPLAGAAEPDGARFAFDASESYWAVELHPWLEPWDNLLPGGFLIHGDGKNRHVVGRMRLGELRDWRAHLYQGPSGPLAAALGQALEAHLAPPARLFGRSPHETWSLELNRPRVMGVVNVTPDSFSDGGRHDHTEAAIAHALRLVAEGADLLDIGGESTRPGAQPVTEEEEKARVLPVIRAVARQTRIPISVDTTKKGIMTAALEAGASIINDVSALEVDPTAVEHLARDPCPVVLMHRQGTPATMQTAPHYGDVVRDVYAYLARRLAWCRTHGLHTSRLLVDPGIGFGKNAEHNLALLRRLRVLRGLGVPILVGVSRKRIVGILTGVESPDQRDPGSHALATLAALHGAHILRVHDVAGARQALAVAQGWMNSVSL